MVFTMKKIAIAAFSIGQSFAKVTDEKSVPEEKRYTQLIEQMEHFNPTFDERQYWTYGCNCLMLGDRPMSDPGLGAPVDQLDSVCKKYKDCLKCAAAEHGSTCIPEFVRYNLKMNNGPTCKDDAGTCTRSLCECDKLFAQEHVGAVNVYSDDYHRFYTTTGWDAEGDCFRGSGGVVDPQCCGPDDGAKIIFNAATKVCCADGTVKNSVNAC